MIFYTSVLCVTFYLFYLLHFISILYYILCVTFYLSLFCVLFYVLHFICHFTCFIFYLLLFFFEFKRLKSMARSYIFIKFINSNLGLLKFNIFTYGFIIKSRFRKIWEFGLKLLIQYGSFHYILSLFSSYFTITFIIFYHYLHHISSLFLPYFITTFTIFYYYLHHILPLLSLYFTN